MWFIQVRIILKGAVNKMKILLIEDNQAVSSTLNVALSKDYELTSTDRGEEGIFLQKEIDPEVILLDINLPDISGLRVCRKFREIGVKAPILIISSDNKVSTKLELFEAGADDYIVKPFSLGELTARIEVICKRMGYTNKTLGKLSTENISLDLDKKQVTRGDGIVISLRKKEAEILNYLILNVGKTVSRDLIASEVWGEKGIWSNTIQVQIKSLRDKLDKPFKYPLITTIHGYGYRLEEIDE